MSWRTWIPIAFSEKCPACDGKTRRVRTRWYYFAFRVYFPKMTSSQSCPDCHWGGVLISSS